MADTASRSLRWMRRTMAAGTLLLALTGAAQSQSAADYPSRPVKVIVPTGAGAALDIIARSLSAALEARLGVPFVVENKPGANATIGSDFVSRAPADGYTLLYTGQAIAVNPSLYKTSYDPVRAFAPIATVATAPITMTVPNGSPYKTVRDLIAAAKARKGELTYGSAGRGSPPDLTAQLFQQQAGIELVHVPYKGAAQALTDVIGGRVDMMFPSLALAKGFIEAKSVRALGIASETRSSLAPDMPTISEMGLPGFATTSWSGIVAPAGTPQAALDKLEAAIRATLDEPAMKSFFDKQGLEPNFHGQQEFAKLLNLEIGNWARALGKAPPT